MPALDPSWELVKRSTADWTISAPPQCYSVLNDANAIIQSVGLDYPVLCHVPGSFASAIEHVRLCTSRYKSYSSILTTELNLIKPLSICDVTYHFFSSLTTTTAAAVAKEKRGSPVSEAFASCFSGDNLGGTGPWTESCWDQTTTLLTLETSVAASVSATAAPNSGQTTPVVTSTAIPMHDTSDHELGKVAIAGAAVGATVGAVLLIAFVVFFARSYRSRRRREAVVAAEGTQMQSL